MPAIDKGWAVTAKIGSRDLVARPRACASFRAFLESVGKRYRAAGKPFFPDDWSGLLAGNTASWVGLTSEEAAAVSCLIGSIRGFVVWTSRGGA